MSIRVKILLLLVLGLLVALCVSVLAYFNAHTINTSISAIITGDMPELRAAKGAREALFDARRTENDIFAAFDPSHKVERHRAATELLRRVEEGFVALTGGDVGLQRNVLATTTAYVDGLVALGDLLDAQHLQLDQRARTWHDREGRVHRALAAFNLHVAADVLDPSTRARVGLGSETTRYGAILDRLAILVDQATDSGTPEHVSNPLERAADDLQAHFDALDRLAGSTPRRFDALRAAHRDLVESTNQLAEVLRLLEGIPARASEVSRLGERAESSLQALTQSAWARLDQRRATLEQQRSFALAVTLLVFVGGTAMLVVLSMVLLRGMARNFELLIAAARDVQRGNLDARVQITSRDELRLLGTAFNGMAQYLSDRRRLQADYNQIVTLLNSTLGIEEILGGSLLELVERSGSSVGAFYMASDEEDELRLARAYGMSEEMAQRQAYRVGAGLIGQAAKTRRKILVSPVPEGAFEIHVGLGQIQPRAVLILPVVHVDRLLGVVVLIGSDEYSEETITFIEEVVFQFGVALNNARFVGEIESTASTLRERTEELTEQSVRLARVNRELENANRLKSDFLANVTHELRTPLNSIIGFTELVLEREDVQDKSRRHLDTVLRNAKSLLGLINDLLDITKIEAGKITMQITPIDVRALADECLQTLSPLVNQELVTLEARVDPTLGKIHTDRDKFKQIMLNLLGNAAKFTDEGAIRVDARPLGEDWVEIAIVDSGIGIHAEDLPYIFDKFRQVDGSTSRKYGGTGLGLAITDELVQLLGGTISAKSEPGAGSTFIVRLARSREAATRTPTPPVPAPRESMLPQQAVIRTETTVGTESHTPTLQMGPMLVVDEQPDTGVGLRNRLRNDSIDVKIAFVCADALALLEKTTPCAVILGRAMVHEGNAKDTESLLEVLGAKGVPVVLVTGEGAPSANGLRVLGSVGRPVDPDEVRAILAQELNLIELV